jgi:hypothetical protein
MQQKKNEYASDGEKSYSNKETVSLQIQIVNYQYLHLVSESSQEEKRVG